MARVLLTGANGFIGTQLLSALMARGDDVRCLVRSTSKVDGRQKLSAQWITGDVTDSSTLPAAVADVDVVYHLAGITRANRNSDYVHANVAGTRNVIESCSQRTTPPVVVLISSLAAAGPMADRNRLRTETDLPQPVSRYGVSKLAGEHAAEAFADRVPITIVRPPIVLGPGDATGLALFKSIRRLRAFLVLGSERRVSVIHVADLNNALIAAAQIGERLPARATSVVETPSSTTANGSSIDGRGKYFVAADEHPTFSELNRLVARAVNRPNAWAIRLPLAVLWATAAPGEIVGRVTGKARYLSFERAREYTSGHWICSAEKAKRDLDFAPAAPLAERLNETAAWYRQKGWL